MPKKGFIPKKLKPSIEARKKFHLTHAQVNMARQLGLNPKEFGSLANHKQEKWKLPLPEYIEHLYFKKFKKQLPDDIRSIEQIESEKRKRKEQKRLQQKQETVDFTE